MRFFKLCALATRTLFQTKLSESDRLPQSISKNPGNLVQLLFSSLLSLKCAGIIQKEAIKILFTVIGWILMPQLETKSNQTRN